MSNKFDASELWKDISETYKNNESTLSNLKQGVFNHKLAYWDPTKCGIRYFKTLLWNLASTFDIDDWQALENTVNRERGNPASMFYNDQYIDLDYAQSVLEFKTIKRFLKGHSLNFLEVGAGYGRTAHVIIQNTDFSNYTIIDLPETLKLSSEYLEEVLTIDQFQKVRFVSTEQINTTEAYEKFLVENNHFDMALNIDSFAEMDIQIVHNYLSLFDEVARFAYIKNPVGKYEKWMIDNEDIAVNTKIVNDALSTGMIQDIVNINSQDEILKASKNFVDQYKPSDQWTLCFDQWAKPWHYYWEAVYQKD